MSNPPVQNGGMKIKRVFVSVVCSEAKKLENWRQQMAYTAAVSIREESIPENIEAAARRLVQTIARVNRTFGVG